MVIIAFVIIAWWRPWEVSTSQARYLVLKSALLLVEIKIALRLYHFRLTTGIKLVALNAKIGYLLLKQNTSFVIHKFQGARMTPNN